MKKMLIGLTVVFVALVSSANAAETFMSAMNAEIAAILRSQEAESEGENALEALDEAEFGEEGYWEAKERHEAIEEYDPEDDAAVVAAALNAAIFKIGEAWDEYSAGSAEESAGDTDFSAGVTASIAFDWDAAVAAFNAAAVHYIAAHGHYEDSEESSEIAIGLVEDALGIIDSNE